MSASTFQVERAAFDRELARGAKASTIKPGGFYPTTLTMTVPKELVHRTTAAEVMLTDWDRVDDTHFVVSAQWPRGHSFFTPVADGYHDPLIGCETVRQIGILLGHAEFGVPFGHQFLVWDLALSVRPQYLLMGYEPASSASPCTARRSTGGAGTCRGCASRRSSTMTGTSSRPVAAPSPAWRPRSTAGCAASTLPAATGTRCR